MKFFIVSTTLGILVVSVVLLFQGDQVLGFSCLGLSVVFILGIYDTFIYRVETTSKEIIVRGFFKAKELKIDDIEFYKFDNHYIYFFSKKSSSKTISIPKYIGDYSDLMFWTNSKFTNKDLLDLVEEEEEVLSNEEYGTNAEERQISLSRAVKTVKRINTFSWIMVVWGIFYPKQYELLMVTLILLPLIAIFLLWRGNGLIVLGGRDTSSSDSVKPSIMTTIIMPGLILGIRVLTDYNIYKYEGIMLLTFVLALFLAGYVIRVTSNFEKLTKRDYLVMVVLVPLLFGFYSFGTVLTVNGLMDNKEPTTHRVEVKSKYESSGKSKRFYLTLDPWGPDKIEDDVTVSYSLYESINAGDTVNVIDYHGFLGVPWYEVVR